MTVEPSAADESTRSEIAELLTDLGGHVGGLSDAVVAEGVRRRREMRQLMAVAIVLVLALVMNLTLLIQSRQRGLQTRELVRNSAAFSEQIADCTNVGGECYEKSQAATRAVIGQLVQSNLYIAECSRSTETDAELEACVSKRLADAAKAPAPAPAPAPSTTP